MRKLRLREVKWFSKGHGPRELQNWDSNVVSDHIVHILNYDNTASGEFTA